MSELANEGRELPLEAAVDLAYGEALLRERIGTLLTGDVETRGAILRDHNKAMVGFERLAEATATLQEPRPHAEAARRSAVARPVWCHWLC